jgi:hypothetical protein
MRMTALVVAFAVLAGAAAWMLNTRPQSIEFSTAAMPSLQELHTMAGVDKLPSQDIDDQSLIYSATPKQ